MIYSKEDNLQVKLNALKHHASFLKFRMERWKKMGWSDVREELQELGNNQFDVYTGELPVEEILSQVNGFLLRHHIINRADLQRWLGKAGYKTIVLSDQSRWVIREGESLPAPVHLHPGRNQEQIKRIRATHLKTAIALIYEKIELTSFLDECATQRINSIRIAQLDLSPVKSIKDSRKIMETVKFLMEVR
jgi:hypothetical protein